MYTEQKRSITTLLRGNILHKYQPAEIGEHAFQQHIIIHFGIFEREVHFVQMHRQSSLFVIGGFFKGHGMLMTH